MKTRTINEMRAYCEEATEGPWLGPHRCKKKSCEGCDEFSPDAGCQGFISEKTKELVVGHIWYDGFRMACKKEDADFIANARTLFELFMKVRDTK